MKKLFFASVILLGVSLTAQPVPAHLLGTDTDSSWFTVRKPEFNSAYSDFCVTQCGQQYVFSSSRINHYPVRYFNHETGQPLIDLYSVQLTDETIYTVPQAFSGEINSRFNDEGPATFNSEGNVIVYTGSVAGDHRLLLYQANANGKHWTSPRTLPFCNDSFNYMHPSFAFGDSVLFFASDRAGGFGGTDIYMVRKTGEGWSEPINAGKWINSSSNELFPFYSAAGALYFCSNREHGMGGLDIYGIVLADSGGSPVQLLGAPINSPADDFGFYISADQRKGFFSSNKGNSVSDADIYSFTYDIPVVQHADTIVPVKLCFTFFEEQTSVTGDTARMKYTWTFGDGDVRYGYVFDKCFDTTGEYEIHLNVRDSSGGDMIVSDVLYTFRVNDPNYISVFAPDTIQAHEEFAVIVARSLLPGYKIEKVFYDFGNGMLCRGRAVSFTFTQPGTYYPVIYLQLRNETTGATESRCVVKKIIVI